MRHLVVFLIAFILFFFPKTVNADEGWVIDSFQSNISILQSGEVEIKENIDVDFKYLSKHGIYRDIPYVYEKDGEKTYTEIDVKNVQQNGNKAKYSVSRNDSYLRIKIGDPDSTITGVNNYEIDYVARGILRGFEDHDELYWNVTGNYWAVPITTTSASVSLPSGQVLKTACFQGYFGSTGECVSITGNPALFNSSEPLGESQGMTIVAGYEKGSVPLIVVEKPKTFWEKFVEWPSLTTLGIATLFGVGTIVLLWLKNGRDYWFGQNIFGKNTDAGVVKPIGAHEALVVEYTPPENLRPAELGTLIDERADTLDVVSTIIDLATRGFLVISEIDKKWVFGKTDYELTKKAKDPSELLKYEKMLLDELFAGRDKVKMSDLKLKFYDELKKIKEELHNELISKKLFPTDPEKVRTKYYLAGFLMLFAGVFSMGFVLASEVIVLADLCFGLFISGIVTLAFARHMPRRTAYGRELYRRVRGYRMFIEKSEKHRQKFFEKKNMFNEVLPYAIMFGLTAKFAKAMEEMGLKSASTGWYVGTHPFNMGNFSSSMNSFSNSMTSAIASTPSSSGGFSGGGSSGGGFGGGGGGSW